MLNDLDKVARAQREAAQLVAEAHARGMSPAVASMVVLLHARDAGLPLPDDALAWATGGQISDDDYLPKNRPSPAEAVKRLDAARDMATRS